jgi:hypothetical protein
MAALVLAGVAGADSPITFTDPAGDAGRSIDITGLAITESHGGLWFQITLARPLEITEDGPLIALDLDQNPDTGSAYYGTEVEVVMESSGNAREAEAVLRRSDGWDFRGIKPPEGWGWGWGPREVDFFLDRAYLGLAPTAGFNIVVAADGSHPDTAPDIRTFNYQPIAGTSPPALGTDARAPHVTAYPTDAIHGKLARLTYSALDGRGKTSDTIRIYRGNHLLRTIRLRLHDSNPFEVSDVTWRVPRGVRGPLRFSVSSVDAAGNQSKVSWARLSVR